MTQSPPAPSLTAHQALFCLRKLVLFLTTHQNLSEAGIICSPVAIFPPQVIWSALLQRESEVGHLLIQVSTSVEGFTHIPVCMCEHQSVEWFVSCCVNNNEIANDSAGNFLP